MDWRYNTLWFEQVDKGKIFVQDFKENTSFENDNDKNKAQYVFLNHLNKNKAQTLDSFQSQNILYLGLTWCNMSNFELLSNFKSLKRLETHYCTKLESDLGLSEFQHTLEFLHINQSKKLVINEELKLLKNLKVLCLNSCAPIDDLEFLKHFPKLIDFRFVDTKINSGDLNPILDHPTIRTVGLLDKRHYNYKSENLSKMLEEKHDGEYKTKVYKGGFMTYRYDYD